MPNKRGSTKRGKWVNLPPDPRIIKAAYSMKNHLKGLKVLEGIWKRGVQPEELERHFYVTWLGYCNGNVLQLSKKLGLHRNTLIYIIADKLKNSSTIRLRNIWKKLGTSKPRIAFTDRVFLFYKAIVKGPIISKIENEGLTNLWLMGVPLSVLAAHFVIRSFRQGMNVIRLAKSWNKSTRTIARVRTYALEPGSPENKWLKPLKIQRSEWFFKRGRK